MDLPPGFIVERGPGRLFLAAADRAGALRALEFDRPAAWQRRLGHQRRGSTVRLELGPQVALRLKQLRRGGLFAALWHERFVGRRRLLANLTLALAARERGIPTPAPVALLVVAGPPGLYRAWLASEELTHAEDLRTRFQSGVRPSPAELAAALAVVRQAHDRGLEHRDLNLGNLAVRTAPDGRIEAFVLDLDRARLHPGPLPARRRRAALRRLERSGAKLGVDRVDWKRLYGREDVSSSSSASSAPTT
ncbi:MAG TPA: lipopolysaccharide kinase InaA family protein [Candidatus Polarisedimenticolaceae bacterium]|nr:lipopolysaccharide kinase InaA family protein [Candidatus Polarisedimenticolaceae bacterium]